MASCLWTLTPHLKFAYPHANTISSHRLPYTTHHLRLSGRRAGTYCTSADSENSTGVQVYRDIERILTETAQQSQRGWDRSGDWSEIEGAWVLRPKNSEITSILHFVGGIFVGAAPQLTYRLFLERLADRRTKNRVFSFCDRKRETTSCTPVNEHRTYDPNIPVEDETSAASEDEEEERHKDLIISVTTEFVGWIRQSGQLDKLMSRHNFSYDCSTRRDQNTDGVENAIRNWIIPVPDYDSVLPLVPHFERKLI